MTNWLKKLSSYLLRQTWNILEVLSFGDKNNNYKPSWDKNVQLSSSLAHSFDSFIDIVQLWEIPHSIIIWQEIFFNTQVALWNLWFFQSIINMLVWHPHWLHSIRHSVKPHLFVTINTCTVHVQCSVHNYYFIYEKKWPESLSSWLLHFSRYICIHGRVHVLCVCVCMRTHAHGCTHAHTHLYTLSYLSLFPIHHILCLSENVHVHEHATNSMSIKFRKT